VACETLVNTGLVVVSGEISTTTYVDIQDIARETIRRIGYVDADLGFSADSCAVINAIDKQSPDIAQGVDSAFDAEGDAGAGDQGMMFGYATRETPELMPLPISLAHKLARRLASVRRAGTLGYLRPDGKTQVTVRYRDGRPVAIERVLISTQHREGAEAVIRDDLWEHVIEPVLPGDLYDAKELRRTLLVNPTGRFVIGGPVGDAGLTGRKIIVDTYGGMARHGGGAFSGKDPRSASRARSRSWSRPSAPRPSGADGSSSSSTSTSTCARARSASTSSCTARSTRRPPPTGTSGARTRASRGSARTRRRRWPTRPGWARPQRSRPRRLGRRARRRRRWRRRAGARPGRASGGR
jgi:hypothetical protein